MFQGHLAPELDTNKNPVPAHVQLDPGYLDLVTAVDDSILVVERAMDSLVVGQKSGCQTREQFLTAPVRPSEIDNIMVIVREVDIIFDSFLI